MLLLSLSGNLALQIIDFSRLLLLGVAVLGHFETGLFYFIALGSVAFEKLLGVVKFVLDTLDVKLELLLDLNVVPNFSLVLLQLSLVSIF